MHYWAFFQVPQISDDGQSIPRANYLITTVTDFESAELMRQFYLSKLSTFEWAAKNLVIVRAKDGLPGGDDLQERIPIREPIMEYAKAEETKEMARKEDKRFMRSILGIILGAIASATALALAIGKLLLVAPSPWQWAGFSVYFTLWFLLGLKIKDTYIAKDSTNLQGEILYFVSLIIHFIVLLGTLIVG